MGEEVKSKGQLKREAEAAQVLGRELVELPAAQFKILLEKITLPNVLIEAMTECRTIKSHEARRRQLQYIGKLMRDVDPEPIQKMLVQVKRSGQVAAAQLHQLERWRERLLTEGETALSELIQLYARVDADHIRQLAANAKKEAAHNQPPRAARQLFKYLREMMTMDEGKQYE